MATTIITNPDPRYPVGKFVAPAVITDTLRREFIRHIADAPAALSTAVSGLSDAQLDTPYRPGGWTLRQVAHHLADSHMNAFIRHKFALTQEQPTIMPYDEARWAETPDCTPPAKVSVQLIEALHQRWTTLWLAMAPADFARTLNHPERGVMTLDDLLALYAWHSRHHVAHITTTRKRQGW